MTSKTQSSEKPCDTFRQITQKRWTTLTWDLEILFMCQSFRTFHFLDFFHWTVSDLRDNENTLIFGGAFPVMSSTILTCKPHSTHKKQACRHFFFVARSSTYNLSWYILEKFLCSRRRHHVIQRHQSRRKEAERPWERGWLGEIHKLQHDSLATHFFFQ